MKPGLLENRDEQYVWPWMGVLVNVPTKREDGRLVGASGSRLKEQLSCFYPLKVIPLWSSRGHTGTAIIEFGKDWSGFENARAFESHFAAKGQGKRDWKEKRNQHSELFGWVARKEDYNFWGPTGNHLRKNGNLRTINDHENEGVRRAGKLVADLASKVEVKDMRLHVLKCEYDEINTSLDKMVEEKEKLFLSCDKDISEKQQSLELESKVNALAARSDYDRRNIEQEKQMEMINGNQKLRLELESKMNKLDVRTKQLDDLGGRSDYDRRNIEQEQMNAVNSNHLKLGALEYEADENVLKLLEEHVREKKAILNKIEKLKEQLHEKQMLELEIKRVKGELEVMKLMPHGEESESKNKIDKLSEELQVKMSKLDAMRSHTNELITKDLESNTALQEARKVLQKGFRELSGGRAHVGIKKMGELDLKPFLNACSRGRQKRVQKLVLPSFVQSGKLKLQIQNGIHSR